MKRLSSDCKMECLELAEVRLSENPSPAVIDSALLSEAREILRNIPKNTYTIAMCIEGKQISSTAFSEMLEKLQTSGFSRLCFVIGGSFGLHHEVKEAAQYQLSISKMTLPHHLARVILAEQIYRAVMISKKTKYHK